MMLLKKIAYHTLDLLFPCVCAGCGVPVSYASHGICANCMESIAEPDDPCPVCSGPMNGSPCLICSSRMTYMDRTVALGEYEGALKKIISSVKFGNNTRVAGCLAELAAVKAMQFASGVDYITAVPMNKKKKWRRGFNQSELLARKIAARAGIRYRDLLREKPGSGSQKILSVRERYINIIGRYEPVCGGLHGKSVIIVDDVFTTGSTINECSRVLREAGCSRVFALVLARVPSGIR